MSAASTIVGLLARTLSPAGRARYREEWLADVEGAEALGMSRRSVVAGALAVALTADRTDPDLTGISRGALTVRRARWSIAFLSSAAVISIGSWITGGMDAGSALALVAVAFTALGVMFALSAITTGATIYGTRRVLLIVGIGVVGLALMLVGTVVFGGLLAIPGLLAAGAAAVVVATRGGAHDTSRPVGPRPRRILIALIFSVLTLGAVALGTLHITIWNPLAHVPELTLDEIYSAMADAREGTGTAFIIAWAVFWGLAALALPVVAGLRRLERVLSTRRIIVLGLLVVSGTIVFQWFAGFSMGMGIADTFMTSGADAADSGRWLGLAGTVALVGALLVGLSPARMRADREATGV